MSRRASQSRTVFKGCIDNAYCKSQNIYKVLQWTSRGVTQYFYCCQSDLCNLATNPPIAVTTQRPTTQAPVPAASCFKGQVIGSRMTLTRVICSSGQSCMSRRRIGSSIVQKGCVDNSMCIRQNVLLRYQSYIFYCCQFNDCNYRSIPQPPTTTRPTTQKPTTEAPTTQKPTTLAPTTQAPTPTRGPRCYSGQTIVGSTVVLRITRMCGPRESCVSRRSYLSRTVFKGCIDNSYCIRQNAALQYTSRGVTQYFYCCQSDLCNLATNPPAVSVTTQRPTTQAPVTAATRPVSGPRCLRGQVIGSRASMTGVRCSSGQSCTSRRRIGSSLVQKGCVDNSMCIRQNVLLRYQSYIFYCCQSNDCNLGVNPPVLTTEAPTTRQLTTRAPTTRQPTTRAPTTQTPTTQEVTGPTGLRCHTILLLRGRAVRSLITCRSGQSCMSRRRIGSSLVQKGCVDNSMCIRQNVLLRYQSYIFYCCQSNDCNLGVNPPSLPTEAPTTLQPTTQAPTTQAQTTQAQTTQAQTGPKCFSGQGYGSTLQRTYTVCSSQQSCVSRRRFGSLVVDKGCMDNSYCMRQNALLSYQFGGATYIFYCCRTSFCNYWIYPRQILYRDAGGSSGASTAEQNDEEEEAALKQLTNEVKNEEQEIKKEAKKAKKGNDNEANNEGKDKKAGKEEKEKLKAAKQAEKEKAEKEKAKAKQAKELEKEKEEKRKEKEKAKKEKEKAKLAKQKEKEKLKKAKELEKEKEAKKQEKEKAKAAKKAEKESSKQLEKEAKKKAKEQKKRNGQQ